MESNTNHVCLIQKRLVKHPRFRVCTWPNKQSAKLPCPLKSFKCKIVEPSDRMRHLIAWEFQCHCTSSTEFIPSWINREKPNPEIKFDYSHKCSQSEFLELLTWPTNKVLTLLKMSAANALFSNVYDPENINTKKSCPLGYVKKVVSFCLWVDFINFSPECTHSKEVLLSANANCRTRNFQDVASLRHKQEKKDSLFHVRQVFYRLLPVFWPTVNLFSITEGKQCMKTWKHTFQIHQRTLLPNLVEPGWKPVDLPGKLFVKSFTHWTRMIDHSI